MSLPLHPPFPPMEALSVAEIPSGPEWQYEPKWDGFRCLVFREGDRIELQSKETSVGSRPKSSSSTAKSWCRSSAHSRSTHYSTAFIPRKAREQARAGDAGAPHRF